MISHRRCHHLDRTALCATGSPLLTAPSRVLLRLTLPGVWKWICVQVGWFMWLMSCVDSTKLNDLSHSLLWNLKTNCTFGLHMMKACLLAPSVYCSSDIYHDFGENLGCPMSLPNAARLSLCHPCRVLWASVWKFVKLDVDVRAKRVQACSLFARLFNSPKLV